MNIGYEAKRITHNATGLGNYGRFIIRILATYYPDNIYNLYSPSPGKERLRCQIENLSGIRFHYPEKFFHKMFKFIWRSGALVTTLKRDKVELFHGLSNELPLGLAKNHIPSIVTIHDLIFLRYPEFYKPIDRCIYTYKFKRACRQADRIIAVSEMTKQDIIHFFGIDEKKISVVYQGCDASFTHPVSNEVKKQVKKTYRLPEKYILNVGSIESRKNLMLIVKAMALLEDKEIALVAVGKHTPYTDEVEQYIQEHHLSDRIFLRSDVSFADLPAIYQMASLFIYPSFFEGFGIPIIEAIHSGLPVIAATGSCLEEAGGPGSVYINPNDEVALAGKINQIFSSPELAEKMKTEGKTYVQRFEDEVIAKQLIDIYQSVARLRP
ncbi:glycosyltransferase family 1 protein [Parabacteroides sp. AM08-6]|uniref:glycosyltransferase family 4 protein n=1 Tax=Parabacteroides sp. AM08-6 TaxID=2292053 RepID=UPI000F0023C2|nr:glycosyltransferase family 1 protein [Parabacteroides sp. AM08-6]RHJ84842.1 glycosyltransferase family 1 protein [Parabacteroides sp. AM08-6]